MIENIAQKVYIFHSHIMPSIQIKKHEMLRTYASFFSISEREFIQHIKEIEEANRDFIFIFIFIFF